MTKPVEIRILDPEDISTKSVELSRILLECVHGGASLGFLDDMSHDEAGKYWEKVAERSTNSELLLLIAVVNEELAGTVQLILSPQPNQPHRADVAKLLVSPRFRRLGIARALMQQVEVEALALGRNLLVLDTLTGTGAETLYFGLGWTKVGEIPRYALLPEGGEPLATSVFYKDLTK